MEHKMGKRKEIRRHAQERAAHQERKLAEEHERYFLGSARVEMDTLHFVEACFPEFDEKNLDHRGPSWLNRARRPYCWAILLYGTISCKDILS